ncbi:MAG: hypothetical protein ABIP94_25825 [Planctomycetota bacterium]
MASRLDRLESGLELVLEGMDCSGGQLGLIDGLARDAMGAPVLVLLAVEGDALLAARVWSACEFLNRVGDSLAASVPEAHLCTVPGRVFVVGTAATAMHLESLSRLPVQALQVCRLEPFRLAGVERFAVRWLGRDGVAPPAPTEFVVPEQYREDWRSLRTLCERIDPAVRIDGDRYWRSISWNGRVLGQVWSVHGELRGAVDNGVTARLHCGAELRAFGNKMLRRYAAFAGLGAEHGDPRGAPGGPRQERAFRPARDRDHVARANGETLRSSVASIRLSPEECSALDSAMPDGETESATATDDVARIAAEHEGARHPARRLD